jgi:ABC-type transporter lipoprotein component MlaA/predicted alpha/beta-fold hydrolase
VPGGIEIAARRAHGLSLLAFWMAGLAAAAQPVVQFSAPGPPTGLADSAALRATVFGTLPQDLAPVPETVPLQEINIALPWTQPVPKVFWFDRKLRAWFSAQNKPAPLAIVISGTGSDGNTSNIAMLRAALYGAGYHVLTLPSPTFPGFIVAASSTGVAGDLRQDSRDLYAAMQQVIAHLPRRIRITDIDVLGYSLGAANAAVVKSIADSEGKLKIHRAVMINPPVSLFSSIDRLDRLFEASIGPADAGIEKLYRTLYAGLANYYRASEKVRIDGADVLAAAGSVLKTDADFSAAIALTFRIALINVFFAGDMYARTGVVVDPNHPPGVSDSLEGIARTLRDKPFAEYFWKVFAPYYLAHRPGATPESLLADSRLDIIGDDLRNNPDYYAQTNSDDVILDRPELAWLQSTLGKRIAVYDHGGHLGNLGERRQIADMLDMLAGRWRGPGSASAIEASVAEGSGSASAPATSTAGAGAPEHPVAAEHSAAPQRPAPETSLTGIPAAIGAPATPEAAAAPSAVPETAAAPGTLSAAESTATAETSAAAHGPAPGTGSQEGTEVLVPLTMADAPSMYTYDPWERFNRFTYRFNARFDEAVFLPVANGYRRVPSPIRSGIHNFFSNLSEVDSVVNYGLQARLRGGARSLGRFVINSTLGIGGLFDVASRLKLQNPPTGFSATLSTWGVHPGPYLVVPILGPSTLRDGVGYVGDYGASYGVNVADLYRGYQSYALSTVNPVDTRANTDFRYFATGSPFEYEVIRFLYVRKRLIEDEALHGKGKPRLRDSHVPAGQ